MSADKQIKFSSPEEVDVKAEEELLDAIHTSQALAMSEPIGDETESIKEKVRSRLGLAAAEQPDLNVSVYKVSSAENAPANEKVWVQVRVRDGKQTTVKYIPVGQVLEEAVLTDEKKFLPDNGFVAEEVLALHGMAEGLRTAKEIGVITRLNETLDRVLSPFSSLAKLPPIKT